MTFQHVAFCEHELVQYCRDPVSGLCAIIAVHNTKLGPAAGGCRMWPYATVDDAIADALRLSKAMTYKNSVAGLHLGGGKSVIIGDPKTDKSPELLAAFGRQVERLGGYYFTAEDVGIGVEDILHIASETAYAVGTPATAGGAGDPSPYTAQGVFECARVAAKRILKTSDMEGLRVAVQGLGSVGRQLGQLFHNAGAKLTVADIDPSRVRAAVDAWGAIPVATSEVHSADVDIFSPCALGGVINGSTVADIKARIVVGAANNQLDEDARASDLMAAGILYVPDFVANGGGIINVASEIVDGADAEWVDEMISNLSTTTDTIVEEALRTKQSTVEIASKIAELRIDTNVPGSPKRAECAS